LRLNEIHLLICFPRPRTGKFLLTHATSSLHPHIWSTSMTKSVLDFPE